MRPQKQKDFKYKTVNKQMKHRCPQKKGGKSYKDRKLEVKHVTWSFQHHKWKATKLKPLTIIYRTALESSFRSQFLIMRLKETYAEHLLFYKLEFVLNFSQLPN